MVNDVFAEAVRAAVEDRVGRKTMIIPVTKNNGLRLTGITVRRDGQSRACGGDAGDAGKIGSAEAGEAGELGVARDVRTVEAVRNIEPNFYLENIPEDKRTDEYVDAIADEIVSLFNAVDGNEMEQTVQKLMDILKDKEQLLNSLLPRVVNYEWNKEMLEGLPHRRFLDLAITYEIEIDGVGVGHASVSTCRVRNGMIDASVFDITEEELYEAAMRNARLRKYQILPIWDVIERNMMCSGFRPNVAPGEQGEFGMGAADAAATVDDLIPMLVITNESMNRGAYGIVDTELLKSISDGYFRVADHSLSDHSSSARGPSTAHAYLEEQGRAGEDGSRGAGEAREGVNLIIIPSSTNEILALPVRSSDDLDSELETIRAMVSEVNKTNVSLDERLSDSVYIFERETEEVRIA